MFGIDNGVKKLILKLIDETAGKKYKEIDKFTDLFQGVEPQIKQIMEKIEDLENKVKTLSNHLAGMCCQADEDTPSEYRTEHFRSTMDDAYEYLEKIGYFKKG